MSLLSKNSKMKNSENSKYKKIFNWTIPAFMTKDGFKTCPMAGVCASGCYARSGAYLFSNVYRKHEENLSLTLTPLFVNAMDAEIKKVKPDLLRVHDSGDFYSEEYLEKWIQLAQLNPNVHFYAYTKMVELVKGKKLPENFTIIFSLGGKQDSMINQKIDRHSKVFESIEQLQAAGYIDTSHDDTLAIGENAKIGLVYHGKKNYKNTAWERIA